MKCLYPIHLVKSLATIDVVSKNDISILLTNLCLKQTQDLREYFHYKASRKLKISMFRTIENLNNNQLRNITIFSNVILNIRMKILIF